MTTGCDYMSSTTFRLGVVSCGRARTHSHMCSRLLVLVRIAIIKEAGISDPKNPKIPKLLQGEC